MSRRRSNELQYLYNLYSRNLSFHNPSYADKFMCPICLREFGRDALANQLLDRAHVVPKSMGGKLKTLTCRDCNNRHGAKLDSQLVAWVNFQDTILGKSRKPIRGRVIAGKRSQPANIHFPEDNESPIKIGLIPEYSDPKMVKEIKYAFESNIDHISFTLDSTYSESLSRVAILSSAYLMMFVYFGYGYIMQSFLDRARQQLHDPDIETEVLRGIGDLNFKVQENAVATLNDKCLGFRCFIVLLNLSRKAQRYMGVLFPGFDEDYKTLYARLPWKQKNYMPCNDAFIRLIPRDPRYVSEAGFARISSELWEESKQIEARS